MTENWVICLGAGIAQIPLIKNAQRLGYRVLAIDRNAEAPGMTLADDALIESTHAADSILGKIENRKWSALLARCTGHAMFTAASIAKRLRLSGIDLTLAQVATSKSALREFAFSHGIPMPHGRRFSGEHDLTDFPSCSDIIVKPDFTVVGKKSVVKIGRQDNEAMRKAILTAASDSGNQFAEVEEFVEGYDCNYLAWLQDGSATVIFTWDELNGFDESGGLYAIGISTPSLSTANQEITRIRKLIERFASRFPSVRALVAFSFRVDSNHDPWLVEVHADLTGDLVLDRLAPEATGKDYLLMITKMLIEGEFESDFIGQETISVKPTALIYRVPSARRGRPEMLQSPDVAGLHKKIRSVLDGTDLVHLDFLCTGS